MNQSSLQDRRSVVLVCIFGVTAVLVAISLEMASARDGNQPLFATRDGSTSSVASNRLCLRYDDCWWMLGVNYPWLYYGHDFGQAAWVTGSWAYDGANSLASRQKVEADFAYLRSKGVHTVRWFLFADGRASPEFDSHGYVTGLDSFFYDDLDATASLACKYNLRLILVLLDYQWLKPPEWSGGVQLFGHTDIISDTAKRRSFLDKALRPLLERYGTNRNIIAWEVMNEPEWAVCGLGTITTCVSMPTMQSFMQDVVNYTRSYASQAVTVGSAKGQWVSSWQGINLDFYQFHYYDEMGQQPPFVPYSNLGLDKPAILGEFPTKPGTCTATSLTRYLSTALDNGYAGALAWSLNAADNCSDFRGHADEFQAWSLGRERNTSLPSLCGAYLPVVFKNYVSPPAPPLNVSTQIMR